MIYYPDLTDTTMTTAGPHVRAIGWRDGKHAFQTGLASTQFVLQLRRITEKSAECTMALGWMLDSFFGLHTCALCEDFEHGGNVGVPADHVLYVAPAMIFHYVTEHGYMPPRQFVDAVLVSPIPGTKDYDDAVAKFRELHKAYRLRQEQECFEEASRAANKNPSPILDRMISERKEGEPL